MRPYDLWIFLTSLVWMRKRLDSTSGSMIPPLDLCLSRSFCSSHHFCWKVEPIAASSSWEKNTTPFNVYSAPNGHCGAIVKAEGVTSGSCGAGEDRSWSTSYFRGSLHTGHTTVSSCETSQDVKQLIKKDTNVSLTRHLQLTWQSVLSLVLSSSNSFSLCRSSLSEWLA